ncbi:SDR family NAD(P)-dependent oxidoreductase [Nocardioides kongjuensis]|uniref:NAD(P)-dependent dehydrogenase (Short-subunit alcohol dehydrogenase family) n=1 Tax=Nocardioides kongjuensis TaxID=349522 RepID=A0A852RUC8_9ACTN|nr:glucose 1-dehydrogenase [Nocardioides kongjuensis]NYD32826.1 NAD(P)-dependent dehydrogenase (short-subunit alcohol dehydrogenase family) [Nocardioides kongjuensis]
MTSAQQPLPTGRASFDFAGQVVIVTGASGGIGSAVADAFGDAGARLVLHGRREDALESLARKLAERGIEAVWVTGNIRTRETAEAIRDAALTAYGRIDVLVNNAGGNFGARLETLSPNAWNATIEANLSGAFHCATACLPTFEQQGSGVVVNVGSVSANHAHPLRGAYAAAKAGLASLTRTMAWEWADRGIRVNCIEPGAILTESSRFAAEGDILQRVERYVAIGRVGRPEEIAGACLFLCSDAASYITGAVLPVAGGPLTSTPADIDLVRQPVDA